MHVNWRSKFSHSATMANVVSCSTAPQKAQCSWVSEQQLWWHEYRFQTVLSSDTGVGICSTGVLVAGGTIIRTPLFFCRAMISCLANDIPLKSSKDSFGIPSLPSNEWRLDLIRCVTTITNIKVHKAVTTPATMYGS